METMEINVTEQPMEVTPEPKSKLAMAALNMIQGQQGNPWSSSDVDRLEVNTDDYKKLIKACRFFYKKDPLVSSTINKLVEIGINDIVFSKRTLSDNEFRIFTALKDKLKEFAESMALEYLISGLVVPEIQYGVVRKDVLKNYGIKKYDHLNLPVTMYLRDPEAIKIKKSPFTDMPSYFLTIPDSLVMFILNNGKYGEGDGLEDPELWEKFKTYYPDFITAVRNGVREFLIENSDLILRRKPQPDDPYPIPYLSAALESLKHKRNLRRMDYAIASRVIGAIQLFKLGDKDFPVLADDQEEQFGAIKNQILWRDGSGRDVERIFQLFANHTLNIEWVTPDTEALLNEQKYMSVNQDIIYALGFPRILITGESEKTGTSDPEYAMMSPARTMENFRAKILSVLRRIVDQVAFNNNIKDAPEIQFKPLTLFNYQTLLKSLADLYAGGNISRTTYAKELGYIWEDEADMREIEQKVIEDKGINEFAPQPFAEQPGGDPNDPKTNTGNNPQKAKKTKPSDVKNTSNNANGDN
jgi:hypothetical protein